MLHQVLVRCVKSPVLDFSMPDLGSMDVKSTSDFNDGNNEVLQRLELNISCPDSWVVLAYI